jgi:type IV pilus assembly protein PilQ
MRLRSFRSRAALSIAVAMTALSLAPALMAEPAERGVATRLAVEPDGARGASVSIEFSRTPTYSVRLERGGLRLVVDIPNAELGRVPAAFTDPVGIVGGVMAQAFQASGTKTTRILITLLESARYAVTVEGTTLIVRLVPGKSGPLDVATSAKKTQAAVESRVMDLRFEHGALEDRVSIELSDRAEYRESAPSPNKSRLELTLAKLPPELERLLDVSAFRGRVSGVAAFQSGNRVIIEVEKNDGIAARLERQGRSLVWAFFDPSKMPASVTGIARDGGAARKTRTVHVDQDETMADIPVIHSGFEREVTSGPEQAAGFAPGLLAQQRQAFAGRRIDLDLKDADIHNVLRLLADVGQVNIVTADNVQGSVTIRMRNVPWDQALDVVLQSKGLGMIRQANMIRVAPLGDLEKEREMQIARRQQEVKLAPLETRLIPISYATASAIQERAQPLLSERGTMAVDERTNLLIVRDIAGNLNQIEELARSLDTQTPQVLVEARIVEATSRYLRDVGIQWGGDATFSAATGNPTGVAFPNSVGITGGASDNNTPTAGLSPFANQVANPNFAVNLPAVVGAGQGGALGLTFGSINNNFNLALRLSAAEASGMLRILSSPRILTLDNTEARISQGTLLPFSQVSAQGVQTTFQEAKLQLLVRPHVTADGSVSMRVKINRDEPDFNQTSADGDPTILKREAETELLVMDGHTAVIGGIYTRNTGRNLDQVPFFGDIPLLGLLFQRRRASDTRSELVIFLTPRIVNRAEALGR